MQRGMAFIAMGVLLFLCGIASAQTIICDGRTCAGSGIVSWDGQLRDYVYRVTGGAVPQYPDSIFIGTHDPDLSHYSSVCLPPGWTYEIIPMSRPDYSNPINHGSVSPAPDGNCPYTFLFRNVSGAALSSSTPTDFGFNYHGYPHNVDWTVAAFPPVSANWTATVGEGVGPVHGPRCDTLCEPGFPVPYHYLAGIKDNFATTNGPEPSSPSAALLAVMATQSGGADPYFDSPTYDRCFGHTFTGWDASGCIVGSELCFRITAISSGCSNDIINIREDAVNAIWGCYIKFLKAWKSGNPADTFWNVGDTLDVCLDLANMPLVKRGTTYYWPPNILATLQDGDMDFLMNDDTKIDFLELTLEVCMDTCYATGDVNGDGLSLTPADLSALINFVNNRVLPLGPLWQCDLNGDDHVNQLDIDMFQCYLTQGMSCFPIYPVPTDCDPDTTVQFFVKLGAGDDTVTIIDNGINDLNPSSDTIRYQNISPLNSGWISSATVYRMMGGDGGATFTFTITWTRHLGGPVPVEGFIIYGGPVGPLNCPAVTLHGHFDGMFMKADTLGNELPPGEPLQKCAISLTGMVNNNPGTDSVFLDVPCQGRLCSPPTGALADFPYNPEDQAAALAAKPTELYGRLDFTLGPPEGAIHCDANYSQISAKVWLSCDCCDAAGDANGDGSVNIGDAVYVINYIFKGGPPPPSKGEGDANGDCALNIGDAVYVINFIFKGGPPPIINDNCIWP